MRVTNIGWRYDETASVTDPVFVQTEGASIFDPRSYGTGVLTRRDNKRFTRIATGSGSATLNLPWEFLTQLKVGGRYRVNHIDITGGNRTFNYAGPDGIRGGAGAADDQPGLIDPSASLNNSYWQSRGRIPYPTVGALAVDIRDNPRRWVEDQYASEAQNISARVASMKRSGQLSASRGCNGENCAFSPGSAWSKSTWTRLPSSRA